MAAPQISAINDARLARMLSPTTVRHKLSSARHDLVISGPGRATLTPDGGRYTGTLTVTAANVGRDAYDFGVVRVVLPGLVEMSFHGVASPGMSACSLGSHRPVFQRDSVNGSASATSR